MVYLQGESSKSQHIMSQMLSTKSDRSVYFSNPPQSDPLSSESTAATAALFTSPNTTVALDIRNFCDPLKLNLRKQVRGLIKLVSSRLDFVDEQLVGAVNVLSCFNNSAVLTSSVGEVLEALSRCLGTPHLVRSIVKFFRPLLVDLCARWLEYEEEEEEAKELKLAVLAYLVQGLEEIYP